MTTTTRSVEGSLRPPNLLRQLSRKQTAPPMTVAMAHRPESLGEVGAAAVLCKLTNQFKTVMARHKTTRAQIQVLPPILRLRRPQLQSPRPRLLLQGHPTKTQGGAAEELRPLLDPSRSPQ